MDKEIELETIMARANIQIDSYIMEVKTITHIITNYPPMLKDKIFMEHVIDTQRRYQETLEILLNQVRKYV